MRKLDLYNDFGNWERKQQCKGPEVRTNFANLKKGKKFSASQRKQLCSKSAPSLGVKLLDLQGEKV